MPLTQPLAVYALTRQGASLAGRLVRGLGAPYAPTLCLPERLKSEDAPAWTPPKGEIRYFETLGAALTMNFKAFQNHVIVGATGLVVRLIAPLLQSKSLDPAVVVLPQDGRFAVSLLSGHLGGGNRLALAAAEAVGGQAVISTATDLEALPALEMLAREHDLAVEDLARLPFFSRTLVEGGRVRVWDPAGHLTPHLASWPESFQFVTEAPPGPEPDYPVPQPDRKVLVDYRLGPVGPRDLVLRPRVVFLGLGCHQGVTAAELEEFIDLSLREAKLAKAAVAALTTVESRGEEPALLEISRKNNWPLMVFTREELARVSVPNPSAKVKQRIGVASVCEAAALLAARTGRLIMTKRKSPRATLAAAVSGSAECPKQAPPPP